MGASTPTLEKAGPGCLPWQWGAWHQQNPLPLGPSPMAARDGHWAQKSLTRPRSQAPFFYKNA